jgi:hypothetical protein
VETVVVKRRSSIITKDKSCFPCIFVLQILPFGILLYVI